MFRTFRFKLKPTRAQHGHLREALEHSRQLYNAALEERIDCYRKTGKGRSYKDQCRAKKLSQRVHNCACGYRADRDVAAAQVILHKAVRGLGAANASGCAVRSHGKAVAA
jgi:transposase